MTSKNRYFLTTALPMVIVMVICTGWTALLLPQVPDPMAIQFGGEGNPVRHFSPVWVLLLWSGMCGIIVVGFASFARSGLWNGPAGRVSATSMGFIVTLLSSLEVTLFNIQSGASDINSITMNWNSFIVPLITGAIVAVALFFTTKRVDKTSVKYNKNTNIEVPEKGAAVWIKTETIKKPIQAILIISLIFMLTLPLIFNNWIIYLIILFSIFAILTSWSWTLRVDSRGFTYRSPLGIPNSTITYPEMKEVKVVEISAGDWGGWGWRISPSGTGLITRSGKGIRIKKSNGKILEASCEDAETAVALLEHYGGRELETSIG